jgi:diguanylate cyclase (GGDEF)-like protein
LSDFRILSTLYVAGTALVLLPPFTIYNFVQGQHLLGAGALAIILVLSFSAWSAVRGRYYSLVTLLTFVPIVIMVLVYAQHDQGIIGVLWCYPVIIAFYFMLAERHAWLANAALIVITLPEVWNMFEPEVASRVLATFLAVSGFSAVFVRVITRQHAQLHEMVTIDPLTGQLNRVLLQATMEQAIGQSQRTGIPMTLVVLDLDHFKYINDTFGHDAGDRVLRGVGQLLQQRIRKSDKVFRLGGEEFLVLLYNSNMASGKQVAEELRQAIEEQKLVDDHHVTASVGVATLEREEDWKQWIKRADENLYRAKANGRNRVEV